MRDLVEDIVNSFWPFLVSLCWFVFLFSLFGAVPPAATIPLGG